MKPRLAYFSPLPPARSGIADYSRELLPHLSQEADVTVYAVDPESAAPALPGLQRRHLDDFGRERWHYDAAVYQMGNSRHHEPYYPLLFRYPGIVVLHDYGLHHFVADRSAGRDNYAAYTRELGYELGLDGIRQAWAIRYGEEPHRLATVPLNRRLLEVSLGVLVHSNYAASRIAAKVPDARVHIVPVPVVPYPGESRRAELGWEDASVVFASFGQVTVGKRLDEALRAFARLRRDEPGARFLIVGEATPEVDLDGLLRELELQDAVHRTGFVPDLHAFAGWMMTADVVVNLRRPTLGETSATALRALAAGRALVVDNHGWYAELPDDAVVKVPPGDETALLAAMARLVRERPWREQLAAAGHAYAAKAHDPARAATVQLAAIQDILAEIGAIRG